MKTDIPILFVEINNLNYVFAAGLYDDSQNLKIIDFSKMNVFNMKSLID